MIKLIVGLGNFPKEYEQTRHNIGFAVIDKLCNELSLNLNEDKYNGHFTKVTVEGTTFIIAKPWTYMNLSGDFIKPIMDFYKITPDNLLVVADDADTNVGTIHIKKHGSSGGQNGLKDIISKINTDKFSRIKIGIGRPKNQNIDLAAHVLGKFGNDEKISIAHVIKQVVQAIIEYMNGSSIETITNKYTVTLK
jgi:PTH1 family peptidyl-tRNA hydrolase